MTNVVNLRVRAQADISGRIHTLDMAVEDLLAEVGGTFDALPRRAQQGPKGKALEKAIDDLQCAQIGLCEAKDAIDSVGVSR